MTALNNIDYKGPFNYECKIEGETISSKIKSLKQILTGYAIFKSFLSLFYKEGKSLKFPKNQIYFLP